MTRPPNKGFSALEFAMVMLLFMTFTGLVMLYGRGARGKARESNCLSNVKQMAIASAVYASDNDGFYPRAEPVVAIMPYTKNYQVFRCPAAPKKPQPEPQEEPYCETVEDCTPCCGLPATRVPPHQVDYLFVPGLCADDRPDTMLAYDDAPDRHTSKSFNMVRLDGSARRLPAAQWPGPPEQIKEAPDEE